MVAMTTGSASATFPSSGVSLVMEATKVAEMVYRLPSLCNDGAIVPLLQQAGVESFFVNGAPWWSSSASSQRHKTGQPATC